MVPADRPRNSWVRPSILWRSRNDTLARLSDPTDGDRGRWLEQTLGPAASRPADALAIRGHEHRGACSFLVVGDTGEGDRSQMAVVPGLLRAGGDTAFMVICSDVIYPTGDANEYLEKFYFPYARYPGPIYALPGNHDWYDGLTGFMTHFAGADPLPREARAALRRPHVWLRQRLWRSHRQTDPAVRAAGRALRPPRPEYPPQRGPYWYLDAGPVRLVAIDTGIAGTIDAEQGDWLEAVSASSDRPKILLTGSPLYVDAARRPCAIAGGDRTVDAIVSKPAHNYIAAIGGDIHNYQRYPVDVGEGRRIQYLVSGGGGAFMHATHKIPAVDRVEELRGRVRERDVHLYPARGRSLWWFTQRLGRRRPLRWVRLGPDAAGALVAQRLGLEPVEAGARTARREGRFSPRERFVAWLFLGPVPGPGRLFQRFVSEFLDWDDPPMFKSFLRVDADEEQVRIRCFRATGWLEDEEDPPLEDEVTIPLTARVAGPRLRAEPLQPGHLEHLARLHGDPRVGATLGGVRSRDQVADELAAHERHWAEHGFGYWAVFDAATDEFVGRGGLHRCRVGGRDEVEIGWAVLPERWGQGIATQIARMAAATAFDEHALPDVVAFTLPDNLASRRVMEKAGFAYEREVQHAGLPHVLYRLRAGA
jgi:RimJ/RimL family protein N-acetyltransferase